MSSKIRTDTESLTASTDVGLKHVIIISSALVLAAVFGWLACLVRKENGEVEFHWQWRALVWIAAGIGCTVYFWRQVWPKQNDSRTIHRQIKGWVVLAVPCVMWMAYPLRFISGQQLLNVCIGLALAAAVLTLGGWMLFKLIKGFADDDIPPAEIDSAGQPDSGRTDVEQDANPPPTKTLGRDP